MRIACCLPKATDPQSEYVIIIAFTRQQWLRKCAALLRLHVMYCMCCWTSWQILNVRLVFPVDEPMSLVISNYIFNCPTKCTVQLNICIVYWICATCFGSHCAFLREKSYHISKSSAYRTVVIVTQLQSVKYVICEFVTELSLLLHRASCRFTKYHTTNKCTNCMSFIFKSLF